MDSEENLERVRAENGFLAILVTDMMGKILDSARADETSPEGMGEMLALAQRVSARPDEIRDLAQRGESTFFDWEGQQIVCTFLASPTPRLLVVLAAQGKSYKRALGRVVRILS
jgi:hypothetical protein